MQMPKYLLELRDQSESNRKWVESLPTIIEMIQTRWQLDLDKPYLEKVTCSYVINCMDAQGMERVLKIGLPHVESRHEIGQG